MSGLNLIRKVRALATFAAVPVIVVTGASQVATESGLPFFLKPVDPAVVLSAIREHCVGRPALFA